jgi:hypothetical protein
MRDFFKDLHSNKHMGLTMEPEKITNKLVRELVKREEAAYPFHLAQMCRLSVNNVCSFLDYCESKKVKVYLLEPGGYLIFTLDTMEIIDWVGKGGTLPKVKEVFSKYRGKEFSADLRLDTSFAIAKKLASQGIITLKEQYRWYWGKDSFINVKIMLI